MSRTSRVHPIVGPSDGSSDGVSLQAPVARTCGTTRFASGGSAQWPTGLARRRPAGNLAQRPPGGLAGAAVPARL